MIQSRSFSTIFVIAIVLLLAMVGTVAGCTHNHRGLAGDRLNSWRYFRYDFR